MRIKISLAFIFISTFGLAQPEAWTFEKCIIYAFENNLMLKKQYNNELSSSYDFEQSKWAILPSASASSSGSFDLRRSANQNNDIASGKAYSISAGIRANLDIFNGLRTINTIRSQKLLKLASHELTEQVKINLYLDILNVYSEILLQQELLKITGNRLYESLQQLERVKALVEVGQREPLLVDELNATVSGNQLIKTRTANLLQLKIIQLVQLLELPADTKPDILQLDTGIFKPNIAGYSVDEVYNRACEKYPKIKEQELTLEYFEKQLEIQKGSLLPTLSLNGYYGSRFYSTDLQDNGKVTPLDQQMTKYLSPSVGFSLGIPIFSERSKVYNIKRSKLNLENQLFTLQQTKNSIRGEIQEALQILESSRMEYVNATDHLTFVQKSYDANREKFALGLINSTDFIVVQNQFSQAQVDVVSAKLNWVIQEKVIGLYMGEM